jgi:hypothetical protein
MFQPNNKQQKEVKFFLYKNDYHSGPFAQERIREMLIENVVSENDIICEEGKEEWIPISQLIKSSVSNAKIEVTVEAQPQLADIFYILVDQATKGPYTLNQIKTMWSAGSVTVQTMFLQENTSEWMPLRSILHKLEPPPVVASGSVNNPPVLQNPKGKVQTIESTGKGWKALQVLSVLLIIVGFFTLFGSVSSGCGMMFSGFLIFLFSRIGAWWSHG